MNYSTILSFILHGAGLFLFIAGFFPPRISVPSTQSSLNSPFSQCLKKPSHHINRLVVMVIDGWRSDFLFSRPEQMPFLSSHGASFDAHSQHPTVTMPRLKAFLSGIIPSYLDVALNLASSEFTEDNWLKRAVKEGKKVVFYGDDTWLKMFPENIFEARSEGVVSFFVTDYTEVDDNVTRHLESEFGSKRDAWDILIIHYLGLDHVGHSIGAKSNLINVKLNEMDSIAGDIYKKLSSQASDDFAFIILGDHGMAEEGGHGGATHLETNVPVVFLFPNEKVSPNDPYKIEQVDLVPTISALFGFQIPGNSLGVTFIDKLGVDTPNATNFALWSLIQNGNQLRYLIKNAGKNIDTVVVEAFETCLVELSAASCNTEIGVEVVNSLITECHKTFKQLQEEFINLSSEYKMDFLIFGLLFSFLGTSNILSTLNVKSIRAEDLLVLAQPLLNFASSYVEEEKHVWNFLFSSAILFKLYESRKANKQWTKDELLLFAALAFHRVCATMKQSVAELLPANDQNIQIITNIPAIILLFWVHSGAIWVKILLALSLFSHPFQVPSTWSTPSDALLLLFYLCLSIQICFAPTSDALLFWVLSLASPSNKIVILLCAIIGKLISQTKHLSSSPSFFYLALASSFFYTGNSHSLATLNLSGAYTRLPFYNPIFVGVQLFLATYLGPITLLALRSKHSALTQFADRLLFYRSLSLFLCLSALFLHRHHLFVWSVFAPKLVYELFHFAAVSILCFGLKLSSLKVWKYFKFS